LKTKLEREWEALKPSANARKKSEKIKENKDLDKYYDELLKEVQDENKINC
jgi:hypothetical protein